MARRSSGSDNPEVLAARLAAILEGSGGTTPISDASRRRLFGSLVRLHAAGRDQANSPFDGVEVSTEAVVVTAAAMLKAKAVTSFELAALFDV